MTIRQLSIKQSNKYPFCLDNVLNGTQDFRWCRRDDGRHCVVLARHHIHVRQDGDRLEYESDSDTDLNGLLHSYFRLDDDIDAIYADISSRCDTVAQLVEEYAWTRIMRQPDPWECTVSYILSANANVGKIRRGVEGIAKKLGQPTKLDECERHTFPTRQKVLEAGVKPLEELKFGLDKHNRIMNAAERIRDGKLDLCRLAEPRVSYDEANSQLIACKGVGPKIANCIALFSLDKMEAFPVDVHVCRALKKHYFRSGKIPSNKVKWAQNRFGKYAGYANQFLFYDEYQK